MNLEELRKNINELDAQILTNFSERMECCRQVALYKQEHGMQIFQTDREKEVIERIRKASPEGAVRVRVVDASPGKAST